MGASLSSLEIYGEIITFHFFSSLIHFQHVHVHVLPRKAGDFQRNDSIYDEVGLFSLILLRDHRGCLCEEIKLMNQVSPWIYGLMWDSTQYDFGSGRRSQGAKNVHDRNQRQMNYNDFFFSQMKCGRNQVSL